MRVQALWQYPIKSLLGEPQKHLNVDTRGVVGDRLFAIVDAQGKLGSGKTTRRFKRIDGLFSLRAMTDGEALRIGFPDGRWTEISRATLNDELSGFLGEPVTIQQEQDVPHHDDAAVHVLLSTELQALQDDLPEVRIDPRRFRANIVLDSPKYITADGLMGRTLTLGSTRLLVTHKTERCGMVTMAQDDLTFAPQILRKIAQQFDVHFGVYAKVLRPGSISLGDAVAVSSEGAAQLPMRHADMPFK
ncbi:MOSC domain-containing protein [Roseibium sediminicola]|uniref:MOSC domain-containing protein n=1 Tax=Roseibium sediminicola TaxID=2933272 RepID=A0ABT0GX57_9HYPH|nr:MOSC domain-containing protein [Roseibium sp. CAU 1639]